jgi:hypothetical protein
MARGHFLWLVSLLCRLACGKTAEEKFLQCARHGDSAAIISYIVSGMDPTQ